MAVMAEPDAISAMISLAFGRNGSAWGGIAANEGRYGDGKNGGKTAVTLPRVAAAADSLLPPPKLPPIMRAICGTGGRVVINTISNPSPSLRTRKIVFLQMIVYRGSLAQVEGKNRHICAHICVDSSK
jgi:hypothetical protein